MNSKIISKEDFILLLSAVRGCLAHARFDCINAIQNKIKNSSLEMSLTKEDFGKISSEINKIVGRGLKDILESIWHSESTGSENRHRKDASFYFAPGYSQYKLYGHDIISTGKRADTRENILNDENPDQAIRQMENNEKFKQYGFGWDWKTDKPFYSFRLNIWMRQFYEKQIDNHELFGLTKWFELYKQQLNENQHNQTPLSVQDDTSKIQNPLVAICINMDSGLTGPAKQDGVLMIHITNKNTTTILLNQIKEVLENEATWSNNIKPQHSLPVFSYSGKQPEKNKDTFTKTTAYKKVRLMMSTIFDLLCDSIFTNRGDYSTCKAFQSALQKCSRTSNHIEFCKRLRNTVEIINKLDKDNKKHSWYNADIVFRYYYAIPLDESLDVPTRNVKGFMGTANLYTTYEIPTVFLFLIKSWLYEIYAQVRLCESLIDARKSGSTQMLRAFNHEVGNIGSYLTDKTYMREIQNVFEIQGLTTQKDELSDFIQKAGQIHLYQPKKAVDISRWRICPVPMSFNYIRMLFMVWASKGSLKDFDIQDKDILKDITQALIPHAFSIAQIRKQLANQGTVIGDVASAAYIENKFCKTTNKLKGVNLDISDSLVFCAFKGDEAYNPKIIFARLLLAALSNAFLHSLNKININVVLSIVGEEAIFILSNTCKKKDKNKDNDIWRDYKDGTEGVLAVCAENLKGNLHYFNISRNNKKLFVAEIRFPTRGILCNL